MNILLICPDDGKEGAQKTFLAPNTGIERLAAYVRKYGNNINVDVFDPNTDDIEKISGEYDIIGTGIYHLTSHNDLGNIIYFKRKYPRSLMIAGGEEATFSHAEIIIGSPIDIIVLGEGELALLEIIKMRQLSPAGMSAEMYKDIPGLVIRKDDSFLFTGFRSSLNKAQFTDATLSLDFSRINYKKYWDLTKSYYEKPDEVEIHTVRIFTGNICPFKCTFCSSTNFLDFAANKPCKLITLNTRETVTLVNNIVKAVPDVRTIIFDDDNFLIVKKRVIDFSNKIIDLKAKGTIPSNLTFICQGRVSVISDSFSVEELCLMKKAGFRMLQIGIESFCQNILDDLNKKTREDQIWDALEKIKQSGIKAHCYVIMFPPTVTRENVIKNIKSIIKCLNMGLEVGLKPFIIPLPGSEIIKQYPAQIISTPIRITGSEKNILRADRIEPNNEEIRSVIEKMDKNKEYHKDLLIKKFKVKHLPPRMDTIFVLYALSGILEDNIIAKSTEDLFMKLFKKRHSIEKAYDV